MSKIDRFYYWLNYYFKLNNCPICNDKYEIFRDYNSRTGHISQKSCPSGHIYLSFNDRVSQDHIHINVIDIYVMADNATHILYLLGDSDYILQDDWMDLIFPINNNLEMIKDKLQKLIILS